MADTDRSDWAKVHEEALKEYDRDYAREKNNIDEAYEDLRFRRGKLEDQWAPEALQARVGRPCHVVNKLPQFIRQVTGDMRQSRPGIKVVPVDSGGDPSWLTGALWAPRGRGRSRALPRGRLQHRPHG